VLTAVDPEFGIVDLDFETYLGKPVTGDEMLEAVESVTERGDYQEPEGESSWPPESGRPR